MLWNMLNLFAANIQVSPNEVGVPASNINDATIQGVMNTVYFWAGMVAVIVIIVAGFYFVTSNGDSQKVERAKKAILGSVIGLIVIMFAFIITQFVIFGVTEGV